MPDEKKITKKDFATWEDLCSEVPERDHEDMHLPRYNKWIRHRLRVPFEKLMYAQKRFMTGKKKDLQGYMVHLLKYIILEPAVTDKTTRLMFKADGKVLLDVISAVLGDISDLAAEMEEEEEEAKN